MGREAKVLENKGSVRDASPLDFPVIEAIHRSGTADYRLPDLTSPLILSHKVVEGPEGVMGSLFIRATAETFLLLDSSLSLRRKLMSVQALNDAICLEAWRLGLDDLNARTPPETATFHKLMTQLGWSEARPGWSAWSRQCGMR